MEDGVTVVIPTIPPRENLLLRALRSVDSQTQKPTEIIVQYDSDHEGAAVTRQRGLERVKTKWVAFLDDDDEFLPIHLESLQTCALYTGADYVYPWYTVIGGTDPLAEHFGVPWDPEKPHLTTIVTMVRTELALAVGGFMDDAAVPDRDSRITFLGEDYRFTLRVNEAGGKIVHLPDRTWLWHHHGKNTSGLPWRW